MNRRTSKRHNPFKSGQSNQGNNQQNDFQQQEHRNTSQPHGRTFNGPSNNTFNNGNRNFQHDFQQESQHSPNSQNRSYNEPAANNLTPSPSQSVLRTGPCVLCKAATVLICSRCGDFYCSPTCQKNDWQTHRFICFSMPKLVSSSIDIYQNIPTLNGYQNRELPETVAMSPNIQSQNRKWVARNSPTPPPAMQNNQPLGPQQNTQQQQHHPNMHQQHQRNQQNQPNQQQKQTEPNQQQQNQNRPTQRPKIQNQNEHRPNHQTPPRSVINGSEQSSDPHDMNRATNIGKVEQVQFPKNNSRVTVTAIRSSNRIFLRSIEKPENDGYLEVCKTINEYGRNATPLRVMPQKNAFAITGFNDDGLFYRVQVISAKDENNIQVIYFDFGNEATKKLSELKDISMECASLKQYIVMATLKGVPHIRNDPKLIDYMKTLEDIEATIKYNDREKPSCELVIDGVEDSLNKKINIYIVKTKTDSKNQDNQSNAKEQDERQQLPPAKIEEKQNTTEVKPSTSAAAITKSAKSRPSQFAKPVMIPPFEQIVLPIKAKNIDVMIVDNSLLLYSCLGCVLFEDRANLNEIQKYLSKYEDNGREYKPKIEEYCLAKYQDAWYRAKALDHLSAEVVEIVFIDFLNESEVFVKDIRRYPMDLDLPCKTTLCLIQGLPNELTEKQVDYLKNKLQPGGQLKINEVVENHPDGSGIAVCKINQITQWMAEDKP